MRNLTICYIFTVMLSILFSKIEAQSTSVRIIQSEFLPGKIVKTNSFFPKTGIQQRYRLNFGSIHTDSSSWPGFFSYPSSGIGFEYSQLGNDSVFGNEYSLLQFLEFRPGGRSINSLNIQLAIGASYFDSPYNQLSNPLNKAIGSQITWSFRLFAYYRFLAGKRLLLGIGGGYLHSSNGHVVLPNFGLNSGALSFSATFIRSEYDFNLKIKPRKIPPEKTRHYCIGIRQGFGFHTLGGTAGPVGKNIKSVYSREIYAGIIYRQYLKFYGGFTHRYYEHFRDFQNQYSLPEYKQKFKYHTSLHFFLGFEMLMGNIGVDMHGGLTLYKPFYRDFDTVFQKSGSIDYMLKYLFPTRLGLKYYLLKTQYRPKNNFFIGVAINANFGEADFSEFSLGFVRMLK